MLMAAGVFAQTEPRLVADIPFDFYLGDKAFPKGEYELTARRPGGVVVLQSATGIRIWGAAAAHMASNVPATDKPAVLIFEKYDNDHTFLKAARWGFDAQLSLSVGQSRTEREHVTSKFVTQRTTEKLTILARAR
jgi:hypothetical protein